MALIWRVYTPTQILWGAADLTPAELDFIESEINKTKPLRTQGPWEPWIKSPFDFPVPIGIPFAARFTPPGSMRNAFYAGYEPTTSVYETAWHFLRFRQASSAALKSRREPKRIFSVDFDATHALDIRTMDNALLSQVLDPFGYSASHALARKHGKVPSIISPSVRHENGTCATIFEIGKLETAARIMRDLSYAMTEPKDAVIVNSDIDSLSGILVPTHEGRMTLQI